MVNNENREEIDNKLDKINKIDEHKVNKDFYNHVEEHRKINEETFKVQDELSKKEDNIKHSLRYERIRISKKSLVSLFIIITLVIIIVAIGLYIILI